MGNGTTLCNSESVWEKLVDDAKKRNCFHSAEEDQNLAHAIIAVLLELNQINDLVNADSFLFKSAKWKVLLIFLNSFFLQDNIFLFHVDNVISQNCWYALLVHSGHRCEEFETKN